MSERDDFSTGPLREQPSENFIADQTMALGVPLPDSGADLP